MKPARLAILASHPVPYQVPLFRRLAKESAIELRVIYGDDYGVRPRPSAWGVEAFTWKGGITEGYPHVFVPNLAPRPDPSTFAGKLNPGLFAELRRFQPDACLVFGYGSVYHLQSIVCGKLLGCRMIYFSDATRIPGSDARGRAKHLFLSKILYPRFDAFLAIGEKSRRQYLACGVPDRALYRFPYAVDNDHFRAMAREAKPRRDALRRRFGVPEGATCGLYIGRLAPEKNIAELIRAVAGAPGHFLLLVGTGPQQAELARLAAELLPGRHHFAGFLNYDQIGDGYGAADIFALPSRFEPWGLVCNEAMCFGMPIVVSDQVGAAPDLVVPGETGFVYPIGDVPALSRALLDAEGMLRRDPDRVARAVAEKVDQHSIEVMAEGLLEAINAR
ncbi:MAG: glycosyltransferase family 4 protein [Minicystis sp.]